MQSSERMDRKLQQLPDMFLQSSERISTIEHLVAENAKANAQLDAHMANLTVTMDRLANIVIRHEERLDAIDGRDEEEPIS